MRAYFFLPQKIARVNEEHPKEAVTHSPSALAAATTWSRAASLLKSALNPPRPLIDPHASAVLHSSPSPDSDIAATMICSSHHAKYKSPSRSPLDNDAGISFSISLFPLYVFLLAFSFLFFPLRLFLFLFFLKLAQAQAGSG